MSSIEIGRVIAQNFKLVKKLGEGAFGEIFLGCHTTALTEVAVKIQSNENMKTMKPQLLSQSSILLNLYEGISQYTQNQQTLGIPHVILTRQEQDQKTGEKFTIMIMELLGPSLQDLLNLCDKRFSIKTTVMVGLQMIELIKFIHQRGILHRDIKPDNFLIGCQDKSNIIYIIDFGLAKRYMTKEKSHVTYKDGKNLTGTARYCSINTHIGIQQSRRDDIESFAYVLLYFMKGYLPWQNLKAANKKQKYERILQKKLNTPISYLCSGCPKQIEDILVHARNLHFEHRPDYQMISNKLKAILIKEDLKIDNKFDWIEAAQLKLKRREELKLQQQQMFHIQNHFQHKMEIEKQTLD